MSDAALAMGTGATERPSDAAEGVRGDPAPLLPPRIPGIEILRGIAASSVVLHHCWSVGTQKRFPGFWMVEGFGTWGVSLFFLLSGYLLADQFWGAHRKGRLRRFYVRRLLRILPAYYVNVGLLFLFFAPHGLLFSRSGLRQLLMNLTLTHYLLPETASSLNVNGALWTLTNEMLLYALIPSLALFVLRTRWPGLALGFTAGMVFRYFVAEHGASIQDLYFAKGFPDGIARLFLARQFLGILPLFMLGIGAKWLVVRSGVRWRWSVPLPPTIVIVVLLCPSALLLWFVERASSFVNVGWFTVFEPLIGLLMIPAMLFAATATVRHSTRLDAWAGWVGERSFGLYLWHFPIILSVYGRGPFLMPPVTAPVVPKLLLIGALSLLAAHLSWILVERPAQELARRLTSRQPIEITSE